jgi:hypothetical protein
MEGSIGTGKKRNAVGETAVENTLACARVEIASRLSHSRDGGGPPVTFQMARHVPAWSRRFRFRALS